MLTSIHQQIRGKEALAVLKDMVVSYPCSTCYASLENGQALSASDRDLARYESHTKHPSDDSIFFGGGDIGAWRIVLSSRAYRDLQRYNAEPKIMKSLNSTFTELAAGNFNATLVQSKSGAPRIPLWLTKWRSGTSLLWQIDIAPGPGPDMEQQALKVWTVGSVTTAQSTLDEVKKYQMSLSETHVARCLELGDVLHGKKLPKIHGLSGNSIDTQPRTALDIRLVDQAFLDTFNKSFTMTSKMLRSIIEQDTTAEFPFDLSPTEMQILQHVSSPTFILGRSGTGKTTCLVFKMITRYLASYNSSPEKPVQQVRVIKCSLTEGCISTSNSC